MADYASFAPDDQTPDPELNPDPEVRQGDTTDDPATRGLLQMLTLLELAADFCKRHQFFEPSTASAFGGRMSVPPRDRLSTIIALKTLLTDGMEEIQVQVCDRSLNETLLNMGRVAMMSAGPDPSQEGGIQYGLAWITDEENILLAGMRLREQRAAEARERGEGAHSEAPPVVDAHLPEPDAPPGPSAPPQPVGHNPVG